MKTPPPVIARLQGGLGNQLYQYAAGRAVATRLGRQLLLDARTILAEAPARHYDLGAFRIKAGFVSGLHAFRVRWLGSARAGALFRMVFPAAASYRYIRDREAGFDASVFASHEGPVVLHGYWQSFRYFEQIADVLREDLAFRDGPGRDNSALLLDAQTSDSVCVHVRRGDYASNDRIREALGPCDVEYYRLAMDVISARVAGPKFFLFSDDPDWATANVHCPGPTVTVRHNLGSADVEDLRLMSVCRHFVIANSSFSWWGAWLSKRAGKIVVAPSRWFKQDNTPATDRIPLDWIRV